MKDSYGFIALANKPESLFFHFSEVMGSAYGIPVDLQVGDEVKFIQNTDRKSQKEIASCVELLQPGTIKPCTLGETLITGEVTKEARSPRGDGASIARPGRSSRQQEADGSVGRILYTTETSKGRIDFLVSGQAAAAEVLRQGDTVAFRISTNRRDGRQTATEVALVERAPVNEVHGIVRSLKDGFGFIERGDVAKEIFFHYSEFDAQQHLNIGDEVQFEIMTAKKDKPVAQNVRLLPPGTVQFDEFSNEERTGVVSKPLKKPRDRRVDPNKDIRNYGGIIQDAAGASSASVGDDGGDSGGGGNGKGADDAAYHFGVADVSKQNQGNPYTLGIGDTVSFKVAKDKRNGKERATDVVVTEKAPLPEEDREEGIVGTVKDGFGFIKCADRDARLFFHFSEVLSGGQNVRVNDHVNFVVEEQQKQGQKRGGYRSSPQTSSDAANDEKQLHAVRVMLLPVGTVKFEDVSRTRFKGVVVKAAQALRNSFDARRSSALGSGNRGGNASNAAGEASEASGTVDYTDAGVTKSASFSLRDVVDMRSSSLRVGDEIEFSTLSVKRTGATSAIKIAVLKRAPELAPLPDAGGRVARAGTAISLPERRASGAAAPSGSRFGFVSSVKEAFGFIESVACDEELFFHFSELQAKGAQLKQGDAVSFDSKRRSGKSVAVRVALLPGEQRALLEVIGAEVCTGVVSKTVRDSSRKYNGIIEYADPNAGLAGGGAGPDRKLDADGSGAAVDEAAPPGADGEAGAEGAEAAREGGANGGNSAATADSGGSSANGSSRGSGGGGDGSGSGGNGGTAGGGMSPESIHARLDAACAIVAPDKSGNSSTTNAAAATAGAGAAAAATSKLSIRFGTSCVAGQRTPLRSGDEVSFRIAVWNGGESTRAVDVRTVNPGPRKKSDVYAVSEASFTAPVDSVKGQFGFIAHKVEGSSSDCLYYHSSSVAGDTELGVGDVVEFAVSHHAAKDKYTAVNVKLVSRREDQLSAPRPSRMRSKLLLPKAVETNGPKFGPTRQPTLPTPGSLGFDKAVRSCISLYAKNQLTADAPAFVMPGIATDVLAAAGDAT